MVLGTGDCAASGTDPRWYKDAVFYEVSVRAFADNSNVTAPDALQ